MGMSSTGFHNSYLLSVVTSSSPRPFGPACFVSDILFTFHPVQDITYEEPLVSVFVYILLKLLEILQLPKLHFIFSHLKWKCDYIPIEDW